MIFSGCKGFFKRSICNRRVYRCSRDKQCMMSRKQRNRCQYCRLRKCLESGMNRKGNILWHSKLKARTAVVSRFNAKFALFITSWVVSTVSCREAQRRNLLFWKWHFDIEFYNGTVFRSRFWLGQSNARNRLNACNVCFTTLPTFVNGITATSQERERIHRMF